MKFLLDHDVPEDLSYLLEHLGHDVMLLRKVLVTDVSDEAVLRFAHENGCVLLTCNRDDFLALAGQALSYRDHNRDQTADASGRERCFDC